MLETFLELLEANLKIEDIIFFLLHMGLNTTHPEDPRRFGV